MNDVELNNKIKNNDKRYMDKYVILEEEYKNK
jgi:hypothetical protein